MKTVNKLLSLMLVAMLLVSAVPFAAMAEGSTIHFAVKIGDAVVFETDKTPKSGSAVVSDMLKYWYDSDWASKYECVKAWSTEQQSDIGVNGTANAGDKVTVKLAEKAPAETEAPAPETTAAPEATVAPIQIVVKVNNSDNVVFEGSKVPANGKSSKVSDLLTYVWNKDWNNRYTFDHAWNSTQQKEAKLTDSVAAGDVLYIGLVATSTNTNTNTSTSTDWGNAGSTTTTNKFPYKAYLHIYVNNKVDEPAKTVNITEGIAVDGIVNKAEVESVVTRYYKAMTSKGIVYDGLYLAVGNWVSNFAQDLARYDQITGITEARQNSEVHINVMISNATAITTSTSTGTADSSNPKTGDSIVTSLVALGLSASALAAVCYVTGKKRRV